MSSASASDAAPFRCRRLLRRRQIGFLRRRHAAISCPPLLLPPHFFDTRFLQFFEFSSFFTTITFEAFLSHRGLSLFFFFRAPPATFRLEIQMREALQIFASPERQPLHFPPDVRGFHSPFQQRFSSRPVFLPPPTPKEVFFHYGFRLPIHYTFSSIFFFRFSSFRYRAAYFRSFLRRCHLSALFFDEEFLRFLH